MDKDKINAFWERIIRENMRYTNNVLQFPSKTVTTGTRVQHPRLQSAELRKLEVSETVDLVGVCEGLGKNK